MKLVSVFPRSEKLQSLLVIGLLILSTLAVAIPALGAPPQDTGQEYYSKNGVLDTDTYTLYPWNQKSINIGFSKYGELINGADDLGLEYNGVDVFAGSVVPERLWNNGWVIDIHWLDQGILKNIWAYALYTDWSNSDPGTAGPWRQMQKSWDATAVGDTAGGRRTSGWAESDNIKIIYDGPRKAIYLLKTTLYDKDKNDPQACPLVEITIQLVFNKVTKNVMEIKDIKRICDEKIQGTLQIEFSQRAEWDLGDDVNSNRLTYAEFYDKLSTEYIKHPFYYPEGGSEHEVTYDLCQMINTDTKLVGYAAYWPSLISKYVSGTSNVPRISPYQQADKLTSLETYSHDVTIPNKDEWPGSMYFRLLPNDPTGKLHIFLPYEPASYPRGNGVWSDAPWVFVKNNLGQWVQLLENSSWEWVVIADPLQRPYGTPAQAVKLLIPPLEAVGREYLILYKMKMKGAVTHTSVVPLECMPDGTFEQWPGADNPSYGMYSEPDVPYVMAEWDFDLDWDNPDASTHQFRCVSVYGLTDLNNAVDPNQPPVGQNPPNGFRIDSEVLYQLNAIFNPFDLRDSVYDNTFRWAQKAALPDPTAPQVITLEAHKYDKYGCEVSSTHVMPEVPKWGYYCTPSEKVILFDDDGVKAPLLLKRPDQYTLSEFTVTIDKTKVKDYSMYDHYKILYTTVDPGSGETTPFVQGRYEWIVAGETSHASDTAGAAMLSASFQEWKNIEVWLSGLDVKAAVDAPGIPWVMRAFSGENTKSGYYYGANDLRTAFRDDWSTPLDWDKAETIRPYAVSSGDAIIVGGPINNLAAWYMNDFTDALVFTTYGTGYYAPGCWARTTQPTLEKLELRETPMDELPKDELWYSNAVPGDRYGYSIVSVYKDLNGTVGFIVYGYTAEDTYYTCYAIRGGLLNWMQNIQCGTTTLVLEMDYETLHPVAFHVKECLGTFTECTGFQTSFKTGAYDANFDTAKSNVLSDACTLHIPYKLAKIHWCAQVHPDP